MTIFIKLISQSNW